jgi:hypothetical protein
MKLHQDFDLGRHLSRWTVTGAVFSELNPNSVLFVSIGSATKANFYVLEHKYRSSVVLESGWVFFFSKGANSVVQYHQKEPLVNYI